MPLGSRLTAAIAILIVPLLSGCQAWLPEREKPAEVVQKPQTTAPLPLSLIPEPARIEQRAGSFTLTKDVKLSCPASDSVCAWTADYLAKLVSRSHGPSLSITAGEARPDTITFERKAASPSGESYSLDVTPRRIVISAATDAGLLYGAVTLWQLASLDAGDAKQIEIPALHIEDEPRFAWRGVLLDSARHFQSPAFVKTFIDAMALHKLNVLQWHLTDDQGWRVEIKKYPRLTGVGAWRPDGKGGRYGGFYSQDEIRDIVEYARRRNVTIVPEIEMPGHALAAIVAYPKLGSVPRPPKTVSSDWGIFPYLYNVDPSTFRFLDNVLSEVLDLFPSRYIHIGGDEAPKDQWNASPRIQAQMRKLHIKNADALQAWFTARIGRFLAAHHRRLIGWDEILNAELSPDAAVTSWRSTDSAVEASRLGHEVVLSPAPTLYFDYCQANMEKEPPCRGPEVSLKDVYDFKLPKLDEGRVIGLQGNLWTERFDTDEAVGYAAFPRAAALAELGWSRSQNWPGFLERMPSQLARYRRLGLPHSESAFKVKISVAPSAKGARISLANQVSFGEIRYGVSASLDDPDGPDATAAFSKYQGPFDVALPMKVSAATFVAGEQVGKPASVWLDRLSLLRRSSFDMEQCTNDLPLALSTSGLVSMVNVMNPCWIYKGIDLAGIRAIDVEIADLPFNYQIGADINRIPLYPDAPPGGALEVRLDDCRGKVIGSMPLPADRTRTVATAQVLIPLQSGTHDLCLLFARRRVDPVWTLLHAIPVRGSE